MIAPRTPAKTIAPKAAATMPQGSEGPQWNQLRSGIAKEPVTSMPKTYAPTPAKAATPALNKPVCPHWRFRASARIARRVAGTTKVESWSTTYSYTTAGTSPPPRWEPQRATGRTRPGRAHDALGLEKQDDDHDQERARGLVRGTPLEDPCLLELSKQDVRQLLDEPDDQAAKHGPVRGADAPDDHRREDEEEHEKAEEGEHVHGDREEDASHTCECASNRPRPQDHVAGVDAGRAREVQVVGARAHRLPQGRVLQHQVEERDEEDGDAEGHASLHGVEREPRVADGEVGRAGDGEGPHVGQEDRGDHVLDDERDAHGGDQRGGRAALEAPEDADFEEHRDHRHGQDRGDHSEEHVLPEALRRVCDEERRVRADGHVVPVGEVREPTNPVGEGEPGRAEDVDAADDETLDGGLERDAAERDAHPRDGREQEEDDDGPERQAVDRGRGPGKGVRQPFHEGPHGIGRSVYYPSRRTRSVKPFIGDSRSRRSAGVRSEHARPTVGSVGPRRGARPPPRLLPRGLCPAPRPRRRGGAPPGPRPLPPRGPGVARAGRGAVGPAGLEGGPAAGGRD